MSGQLKSIQTPWTDILAAQQNPALRNACLEMLAAKYHAPVHAYIARDRRIHSSEEADDLTQGFFLRFLERNIFDGLDRERGRLRKFLMRSMENYISDEFRKRKTKNAGSPFRIHELRPVVDADIPGKAPPTPEEEFNRKWARACYNEAKEIFRHYCNDRGKQHRWAVFEEQVLAGSDKPSYEVTAARLGITVKDVANYRTRSLEKFQSILSDVIRGTASDEEAEQEIADLLRYF